MTAFTEQIQIDVDILKVWEILADIRSIDEWNPGVVRSRLISEAKGGVGARRYCDIKSGNFLREEVIEWTPMERLTLRVFDTDLPFKRVDIQFSLKQRDDGTLVRVRPDYELKYGLLGTLLDLVMVRRQYTKGMRALLRGLKRHCEAPATDA